MKTVNILTRFMGTKKRPRLIARQGRQEPKLWKTKTAINIISLRLLRKASFLKRPEGCMFLSTE
jgi:hypothetical protein